MRNRTLNWRLVTNCFLLSLVLSGCKSAGLHAPSIDVFGSYFPAWLLSLSVGIVLTVFTNAVGNLLDIRPPAYLGPILCLSLILIFSISIWFYYFAI